MAEFMKFDINTPTKINTYYFGLLSGLSKYLAINATIIIKITLVPDETKDAPICIKLA